MMCNASSVLAIVALLGSGTALAQPSLPEAGAADASAAPDTSAETGVAAAIRKPVEIKFYENLDSGMVIAPILRLAGGLNHQFRTNAGQPGTEVEYEDRLTSTALIQFGVKGQIAAGLTFYSEFERNPGSYGTSTWGGGALQSRANYLRYEVRGASIAAGIITDPASQDFVSQHVLDMLGRDYTVTAPAYWGGHVLSQGLLAQYRPMPGLDLGVSFSWGNPLSTSLSYGFGGNVSELGNLYFLPQRSGISMGEPGSNAQVATISPGLVFKRELPFMTVSFQTTLQWYMVNVDTNTTTDRELAGYNTRAAVKLTFLDGMLSAFGSGSYRRNQMIEQVAPFDISRLDPDLYRAMVVTGGLDFNIREQDGIGVYYGLLERDSGGTRPVRKEHFINVGATHWLVRQRLAVGARYAKLITMTDGTRADANVDYDSYFATLRMLLD